MLIASPDEFSQTLQEPIKATHRVDQTPRPPSTEYQPASHSYTAPDSHKKISPPLNMVSMSSTLPTYQNASLPFRQTNVQHQFIETHQSQGIMYPVQQMPYVCQNPGNTMYNVPYSPNYQHPYIHHHSQPHTGYLAYHPSHEGGATVNTQPAVYSPSYYSQHSYNAGFENNQANSNVRMSEQPPKDYHHSQLPHMSPRKAIERGVSAATYDVSQTIVDGSSPMKPSRAPKISGTAPRGPPRKPKQSGHALWVGNLPPMANVVDLKDHFSKDATDEIESVFLISKSNCAFVNYKSEGACAAALSRFQDSRFHGMRLVCRLRKGVTLPGSGPLGRVGDRNSLAQDNDHMVTPAESENASPSPPRKLARVPERFFVVKSLTVEDLELSRQSGVWATQTHNESIFNEAYESADNVYLIFSANKSGEYFGYARMISPISNDDALSLEMPVRVERGLIEADDFKVTPTEATATAPKGRIIDDTARGTTFWEADSSDDDDDPDDIEGRHDEDDDGSESQGADGDALKDEASVEMSENNGATGAQSLGKPFRIQWMSTERVQFYRTRGMRNPWNANREVKIARDGTEIEPSVGRRLTQLFHQHLQDHRGGSR
ncbi:YT521-B-like domain-containing protein [Talaromyces proteolyticus]|uniref:YT521-B-like domain-containing protein n=1 Tax=Talaromyces proteolyticus TaxID=1131652 RepID=A0AAD4Q173_9EURO|nr:YT521-B-like domain-containing protein [Talaromyces proteolyticus]KAH8698263.1 YT521-B-like domain-containing protein [Talaromyces proteolyticus]